MTASIPMNEKTCIGGRYWVASAALPVFLHHKEEGTLNKLIGHAEKSFIYGNKSGGGWPLTMRLDGTNWTSMSFNTGTVEQTFNAFNVDHSDYKPQLHISKYPHKCINVTKSGDKNVRTLKAETTVKDARAIFRIGEIVNDYVFNTMVDNMIKQGKIIIGGKGGKKEIEERIAVKSSSDKKNLMIKEGDVNPTIGFELLTEPPQKMPKTKILVKKPSDKDYEVVPSDNIIKGEILNEYLPRGSKTKSNVEFGCINISQQGISIKRTARKIQSQLPPPRDDDAAEAFSDEEDEQVGTKYANGGASSDISSAEDN